MNRVNKTFYKKMMARPRVRRSLLRVDRALLRTERLLAKYLRPDGSPWILPPQPESLSR